jgi:hypothetical protein
VSDVTLPGEPNNGGESAPSVSAEQRAVERELHAGAQDAGVRVAGLTEVGEYEATFAGSKDAPVEIGERMTVTVRVGEDGSLLPRRANSDTSTPAATSILEIDVTPSVEFDSAGDAHLVWNGYASQADVATGRIIASSLSGPTTDQQEALQGGRSASEYGKDNAYKDGMLQHMPRSRAEAVTQALSPLVSGGKMNLGRLGTIASAKSETTKDPETPTRAPEPKAAEPAETAEPAIIRRTDFGKWVKRGAVMVAVAGAAIGGTFVFDGGDAPSTRDAGSDKLQLIDPAGDGACDVVGAELPSALDLIGADFVQKGDQIEVTVAFAGNAQQYEADTSDSFPLSVQLRLLAGGPYPEAFFGEKGQMKVSGGLLSVLRHEFSDDELIMILTGRTLADVQAVRVSTFLFGAASCEDDTKSAGYDN